MGRARSLALLAPLLLLLTTVGAYPRTGEPAFGLRQLRGFETSANGQRMTLDFVHDDPDVPGRRLEVNYDVEVAPHLRLYNTDDEEHLASVEASADGKMRLLFDSAAAAAAFAGGLAEGDLLHGHYQGEPGEEAAVFPYHARVLASHLAQETLHLDIDVPTLSEVFINAKARVVVALAPEDHDILTHDGEEHEESAAPVEESAAPMVEPEAAARAPVGPFARRRRLEVTRRELGVLSTWVAKQVQRIAKLGQLVKGVVETTIKMGALLTTGKLSEANFKKIDLLNFNYDGKNSPGALCGFNLEDKLLTEEQKAAPPFRGECRKCYAYSTVKLIFEVSIDNFKVNKVLTVIEGKLDFSMVMDKLFIKKGPEGDYEQTIDTVQSKAGIYVPLGPVNLNIGAKVPVKMGIDMTVSGKAVFGIDFATTATFKVGYQYMQPPQAEYSNRVEYKPTGNGVTMLEWNGGEVGVRLSLLPVVQFQLSLGGGGMAALAYIGGPNFGLDASVAATVPLPSNGETAEVVCTTRLQGTIGADISLKLGHDKAKDLLGGMGELEPKGILSETSGITYTVKAPPQSQRALAGPTRPEWALVGATYAGTLQRIKQEWEEGCSNEDLGGFIAPYVDVSAVLLDYRPDGTGATIDIALTFSYGNTEFSTSAIDLGAFAGISQGVYMMTHRPSVGSSCNSINAEMAKNRNYLPNLDYQASTTNEPIELPTRMYGIFCEDGNKLILRDTKGCTSMVLTGNGKSTTSTRRQASDDAMSNEEQRRKLGHMDRFPRILEICEDLSSESTLTSGAKSNDRALWLYFVIGLAVLAGLT